MKKVIFLALILSSSLAIAYSSKEYEDRLVQVTNTTWVNPDPKIITYFAGQIEQESQWRPHAESKYGLYSFGLVQVTAETWRGLVKLDVKLHGWKWKDRFDTNNQIELLVFYDRYFWRLLESMKNIDDDTENMAAFMLSAYNQGFGSLLKDFKICKKHKSCDPSLWFNNVETNSWKGNIKISAACRINRNYVRQIIKVHAPKYEYLMERVRG